MTASDHIEREHLSRALSTQIKKLSATADLCVFSIYDPTRPDDGPLHYEQHDRATLKRSGGIPVDLSFDGIGVWYICFRHGETFKVRHILLKIDQGRFVHQQTGTFEGYWEDWPRYVAEDKWVHSNIVRDRWRSSLAAG